jgi:hypothetical protein
MINFKFLLLFAIITIASRGWAAEGTKARSGVYEHLSLSVSANGEISGYYNAEQGYRACRFFLHGKIQPSSTPLESWSDQKYPAEIRFISDNILLKVTGEHPGCSVVGNAAIFSAEGATLDRELATDWIGLGVIEKDRASLHSAPAKIKSTRAYLIKSDVVGILKTMPDWTFIEYYRPGRPSVRGWLKSSDLRIIGK